TTQILADGNRIRQVSRGKVYRDSEGRVRTEQAISGLGALAPKANLLQVVFIHDPVASVNYALNPADRTATKSAWTARGRAGTASPERPRDGRGRGPGGPEAAGRWRFQPPAGQSVKTEDLGRQTIEGVPAEGSRTTMTIPAGQIGNEQPIQIVTERWFSPDLNTVVLFKHSDPRTGETLYRLAGINRAEPAAAMFQPPADYSVKDGPAPEMPLARPRR
ncbi:MAG: hypothetical protein LAQ30_23625, partial [Acidobacteriia bacterium]|nr:hypothetical protein [Terriglobia bacterium]